MTSTLPNLQQRPTIDCSCAEVASGAGAAGGAVGRKGGFRLPRQVVPCRYHLQFDLPYTSKKSAAPEAPARPKNGDASSSSSASEERLVPAVAEIFCTNTDPSSTSSFMLHAFNLSLDYLVLHAINKAPEDASLRFVDDFMRAKNGTASTDTNGGANTNALSSSTPNTTDFGQGDAANTDAAPTPSSSWACSETVCTEPLPPTGALPMSIPLPDGVRYVNNNNTNNTDNGVGEEEQHLLLGGGGSEAEDAEPIPITVVDFPGDECIQISTQDGRPLPQHFSILIYYRCELSKDAQNNKIGMFITETENENFISTQLEPTLARTLYPCFDEPTYKANFQLCLYVHPLYQAVSNTMVKHVHRIPKAMAAGRFDSIADAEEPHMKQQAATATSATLKGGAAAGGGGEEGAGRSSGRLQSDNGGGLSDGGGANSAPPSIPPGLYGLSLEPDLNANPSFPAANATTPFGATPPAPAAATNNPLLLASAAAVGSSLLNAVNNTSSANPLAGAAGASSLLDVMSSGLGAGPLAGLDLGGGGGNGGGLLSTNSPPPAAELELSNNQQLNLGDGDELLGAAAADEEDEMSLIQTTWRYRYTFFETPKLCPYLVSFATGDFHVIETQTKRGLTTRVIFPKSCNSNSGLFAVDLLKKAIEFFEQLFNFQLPVTKVDIIALSEMRMLGMENWAMITLNRAFALVDEKTSLERRQRIARLIGHEVAHQWFGNIASITWWDEVWLKEGFCRYLEFIFVQQVFPKWHIWGEFIAKILDVSLVMDCDPSQTHSVRLPEEHTHDPRKVFDCFDTISYGKGASILRMLTSLVGDKVIASALSALIHQHAFGNFTTSDFLGCVNHFYGPAAVEHGAGGADLSALVQQWIDTPNHPLLYIDVDNDGNYKVSQFQMCDLSAGLLPDVIEAGIVKMNGGAGGGGAGGNADSAHTHNGHQQLDEADGRTQQLLTDLNGNGAVAAHLPPIGIGGGDFGGVSTPLAAELKSSSCFSPLSPGKHGVAELVVDPRGRFQFDPAAMFAHSNFTIPVRAVTLVQGQTSSSRFLFITNNVTNIQMSGGGGGSGSASNPTANAAHPAGSVLAPDANTSTPVLYFNFNGCGVFRCDFTTRLWHQVFAVAPYLTHVDRLIITQSLFRFRTIHLGVAAHCPSIYSGSTATNPNDTTTTTCALTGNSNASPLLCEGTTATTTTTSNEEGSDIGNSNNGVGNITNAATSSSNTTSPLSPAGAGSNEDRCILLLKWLISFSAGHPQQLNATIWAVIANELTPIVYLLRGSSQCWDEVCFFVHQLFTPLIVDGHVTLTPRENSADFQVTRAITAETCFTILHLLAITKYGGFEDEARGVLRWVLASVATVEGLGAAAAGLEIKANGAVSNASNANIGNGSGGGAIDTTASGAAASGAPTSSSASASAGVNSPTSSSNFSAPFDITDPDHRARALAATELLCEQGHTTEWWILVSIALQLMPPPSSSSNGGGAAAGPTATASAGSTGSGPSRACLRWSDLMTSKRAHVGMPAHPYHHPHSNNPLMGSHNNFSSLGAQMYPHSSSTSGPPPMIVSTPPQMSILDDDAPSVTNNMASLMFNPPTDISVTVHPSFLLYQHPKISSSTTTTTNAAESGDAKANTMNAATTPTTSTLPSAPAPSAEAQAATRQRQKLLLQLILPAVLCLDDWSTSPPIAALALKIAGMTTLMAKAILRNTNLLLEVLALGKGRIGMRFLLSFCTLASTHNAHFELISKLKEATRGAIEAAAHTALLRRQQLTADHPNYLQQLPLIETAVAQVNELSNAFANASRAMDLNLAWVEYVGSHYFNYLTSLKRVMTRHSRTDSEMGGRHQSSLTPVGNYLTATSNIAAVHQQQQQQQQQAAVLGATPTVVVTSNDMHNPLQGMDLLPSLGGGGGVGGSLLSPGGGGFNGLTNGSVSTGVGSGRRVAFEGGTIRGDDVPLDGVEI